MSRPIIKKTGDLPRGSRMVCTWFRQRLRSICGISIWLGLLFIHNRLHVNANFKSASIRNNMLIHINKLFVFFWNSQWYISTIFILDMDCVSTCVMVRGLCYTLQIYFRISYIRFSLSVMKICIIIMKGKCKQLGCKLYLH